MFFIFLKNTFLFSETLYSIILTFSGTISKNSPSFFSKDNVISNLSSFDKFLNNLINDVSIPPKS